MASSFKKILWKDKLLHFKNPLLESYVFLATDQWGTNHAVKQKVKSAEISSPSFWVKGLLTSGFIKNHSNKYIGRSADISRLQAGINCFHLRYFLSNFIYAINIFTHT